MSREIDNRGIGMTTDWSCIDVAVALPVYNTYTYSVPPDLYLFVSIGKRVLVPFGQRRITGYILGPRKNIGPNKLKLILDILDEKPLFPSSMIPFFKWIADYYMHPIGDVIKCALPGGLNIYDLANIAITEKGEKALNENLITPFEKEILNRLQHESCCLKDLRKKLSQEIPNSLIHTMENNGLIVKKQELAGGKTRPKLERYVSWLGPDMPTDRLSDARRKILCAVKDQGEISVKQLKKLVPTAPGLIKSMAEAGNLSVIKKKMYRDPFGELIQPDTAHKHTDEQKSVIAIVKNSMGRGFQTYLLAGVTGSGKTEVYLQLAAEAINKGYSTLVLVPEIALITQMARRFRARFGESIAMLHSGLSAGERYDQWMRIARQEVDIVIGARSAIFAPFENVGLIIVDEEHDTSYKQESGLRYNARDLAVVRAKLHKGIALLGSATPSIEACYNVATKKFTELTLTERIEKRPLAKITVVDLRKSRDTRGIRRFITPELYAAMKETLDRGEQVLLFLNRRGFATFPVCGACGRAITCKNCDISLTLHKTEKAYKCHYCGYTLISDSNCTTCGSSQIRLLGVGTEKVEAAVKALFHNAKIARMDRDTTSRKGSIVKILKGLRDNTTDILIGTQMVTKGHDFPNITLVGILCADLSLSFPDFRAGERTFQLLAQVSGRAGRGDIPGKVILQTYNPNHFSILAARDQSFKIFYNHEIGFRKALSYPPFSRMVQLKISGKDKEKTRQHALSIGRLCQALQKDNKSFLRSVEVLGPIEASLPRIATQYRWQILLKGLNVRALHQFVRQLLFENRLALNNRKVKVAVDVDPFFMM